MKHTMSREIQFLLHRLPKEEGKVQVVVKDETPWCSQKGMVLSFGMQRLVNTKNLGDLSRGVILDGEVVCSILELTTEHGAVEGKTQHTPTRFSVSLDRDFGINERDMNSLIAIGEFREVLPIVDKQ